MQRPSTVAEVVPSRCMKRRSLVQNKGHKSQRILRQLSRPLRINKHSTTRLVRAFVSVRSAQSLGHVPATHSDA